MDTTNNTGINDNKRLPIYDHTIYNLPLKTMVYELTIERDNALFIRIIC